MRTFLSAKEAITWKWKRNLTQPDTLFRTNYSRTWLPRVAVNCQLIPSEDARKRTKNVDPYMQFFFMEKKAKNVSCDFYDEVLKITLCKKI